MEKRKIEAEIITDESGSLCYNTCRFLVGDWCDAFIKNLERLGGFSKFKRCQECLDCEIKK